MKYLVIYTHRIKDKPPIVSGCFKMQEVNWYLLKCDDLIELECCGQKFTIKAHLGAHLEARIEDGGPE